MERASLYRLGRQTERRKIKFIKIRRGLKQPPIDQTSHNNQPKTGGRDGGDYGGEARRVGGVGKRRPIVWGGEWNDTKIKNIKYIVALIGPQSANQYTTINQKQAAATEGTMEVRRDEWEAWGSAIPLFFEGAKFKGR
jgi:hypothetical protein